MSDELMDRVRTVVGPILEVEPERITERSSPNTIATWDSLKNISIVLALEQEFDVSFSETQIQRMNSVAEILVEVRLGSGE